MDLLSFDLAPGSVVTTDASSIVPLTVTVANNVFSQPALDSGSQETMVTFLPSATTTVVYYDWTYDVSLSNTGHAVNVIVVNDYTAMVDPPIASIPTAIALCFDLQEGTLNMSQSVYIPSTQTWTLSFYAAPFKGFYTASDLSLTASIGGASLSGITVSGGFQLFTLAFAVSAAGYYTLSFIFTSDGLSNTAMFISDITIA